MAAVLLEGLQTGGDTVPYKRRNGDSMQVDIHWKMKAHSET